MNANERLEALKRRYQSNFAGHPRISRSVDLLNEMITEAEALLEGADAASAEAIEAELKLYRREATSIAEAQAQGEGVQSAHHSAAMAEQVFARYRRHFAGEDRRSRDLGLMDVMIEDLEILAEQLRGVDDLRIKESLGHADQYLDLFKRERQSIAQLRLEGTLSAQSDLLAKLANDQLYLYRDHFAGQSRLSRRPILLERIIYQLDELLERMRALTAQGFHAENHQRNASLISDRVAEYRVELRQIREAKGQSTFEGLVNSLGEAANKIFEAYRAEFAGKSRGDRDLKRLDALCEGLYQLARQMDDLDRVREDAVNHQNLQIVLDHLRLYGKERGAITAAQSPTP